MAHSTVAKDPNNDKRKLIDGRHKVITAEEYEQIKQNYPNIQFNDEDWTFVSSKGKTLYAGTLKGLGQKGPRLQLNKDKYDLYIRNLIKGNRVSEAAKNAGLTYAQVHKRREIDPDFRELELQAETQAAEPIENALYEAALSGNVPAAIKWLEKRAPKRWPGDKVQIEQTNTLELDATDNVKNIIDLIGKLQQRNAIGQGYIDVEATEPD